MDFIVGKSLFEFWVEIKAHRSNVLKSNVLSEVINQKLKLWSWLDIGYVDRRPTKVNDYLEIPENVLRTILHKNRDRFEITGPYVTFQKAEYTFSEISSSEHLWADVDKLTFQNADYKTLLTLFPERKHLQQEEPELDRQKAKPFENCKWEHLHLTITDNGETLSVENGETKKRYPIGLIGFTDKRSNKPTNLWILLKEFAKNKGVLDANLYLKHNPSVTLKDRVYDLNNKLNEALCIDGNPISFNKQNRSYWCKFRIVDNSPDVYEN